MKSLKFFFILVFVVSCAQQESSKTEMVESNPNLIGQWFGEVSFLTTEFNNEFGKLQVDFEIHLDNSITGELGDATIIESRIKKRSWGFEIRVKLDSKLKKTKDFNKKRCTILFSHPDKINEDTFEYNVDFHAGAQVGWVILKKNS